MDTDYIQWLQNQGVPLFRSSSAYWQLYNRALVPASLMPSFFEMSVNEANELLQTSGAWFLRYTSHPTDVETPWWYIVCDHFDSRKLTSKLRTQIRHGIRHCSVERVTTEWFSENGYPIYLGAHERYVNATPIAEATFRRNALGTLNGPVEYWGVFIGKTLAAYSQCTIENGTVDATATRFHPAYLRFHTAHAMISSLIEHYVQKQHMILSNGQRSVSHQTNFQEFLLKLGFRKRFCRLRVVYRPWLKSLIRTTFPLRNLVSCLPDRGPFHNLQALMAQEEIIRQC